jgi:hypothetical protein
MTRTENEKQYQFIKLCCSLTRQGFNFVRSGNELIFDSYEAKQVKNPFVKTPFVDAFQFTSVGKNKTSVKFFQWADQPPFNFL